MQGIYGILVPPRDGNDSQRDPPDGSQPHFDMAPPPDAAFSTRDELLNYLKQWAASQGYAVVIGRSRANRLWIRCDRGGTYHDKHADDPTQRQRKRKISRLTGCEFSIKASMRKDGIWRTRCERGEHNHGPTTDLREHPSLRRMTEEQLQAVYSMTEQGKSPAHIMAELPKRWPDIKVIRRDIYNARKNFKTSRDGDGPEAVPRTYDDSNDRSSDTTDQERWLWPREKDETKKKRRMGETYRVPGPDSTQPASPPTRIPPMLGRSGEATIPSRGIQSHQVFTAHSPFWHRPRAGTPPDSPPLASPGDTPHNTARSLEPDFPPVVSMRSPQPEAPNSAPDQISSGVSPAYGFAPSQGPHFPQHILSMNAAAAHAQNLAGSPPASGLARSLYSRRPSVQLQQMHRGMRTSSVGSAGASATPGASRRPSQSSTPANVHPPMVLGGGPPPAAPLPQVSSLAAQMSLNALSQSSGSRPATAATTATAVAAAPVQQQGPGNESSAVGTPLAAPAAMAAATPSSSSSNAPAAGAPQVKPISGVAMMQRMQRMEEDLKEQKETLREQKETLKEQKETLKQILALFQSQQAVGAANQGIG